MSRILFVCSGNVGRSQIAEGFYNYFTKTNNAFSAGTNPSTPLKYPTLPPILLDLMKEMNIDMSNQKVKLLSPEMVKEADKIFIMCEKKLCPEFLLKSNRINFWNIEDPYKKSIEEMRAIRDIIKEKIISII